MKVGNHDTAQRVLLIAEIGNNHEGDLGLAAQMVHAAAHAGAHVVKFQTLRPDGLVTADQQARRVQLQRFALPEDAWAHLAGVAADVGAMFMSTPFDLRAVDLLDPLVPAWKIASGDLTFLPLLDRVAATNKPVIISTGMATMDEVRVSVLRLRAAWGSASPGLTVMHCVSCYPTRPEDANLGRLTRLADELDVEVGYSDHTLGTAVAPAAVALGARIIEKHFTMDKQQSEFRDHQLSADPNDLADLAQAIRTVEQAVVGDGDVVEGEASSRDTVRRAVAVSRDIAAGSTVTSDDLTWLRGAGLAPGSEAAIIGKPAVRDLAAGMLLTPADFGQEVW